MWPLVTWGLRELMEERDSSAEMLTALASGSCWARLVPVLVATMMQQDFIAFETSLYTSALCPDSRTAC